ncbi:MAG: hypothetical protein IPM84_10825 [Anaerolineae bacterium]|nr:hypothetical protein [Anaerolineae bacterium]
MVNVNGRVLLFGGRNSTYVYNDLWEFDPSTNTFRQIVPSSVSPPPRYSHGAAEFNGRMYVLGGHNVGSASQDLWYFASGTNTWTQGSSHPTWPAFNHTNLSHLGDFLYRTSFAGLTSRYDPGTDTWTSGYAEPAPPGGWVGTAPVNGKLCSFKVEWSNTQPPPVKVICYEEWTGPYPPGYDMSLSGELQPYTLEPAMAWWGNTVWLLGGHTSTGSNKQVWQYTFTDATTVAVTRLPDMPTPRTRAAAAPLSPRPATTAASATIQANLPIVVFGGQTIPWGGAMADTMIYTVTVSANFVYLPLTMR